MELNLQQNVTLIADTDLSMSRKEFSHKGQEFIDDVIGDDKVNIIVAIYSASGKVLFKNDNAQTFNVPDTIPTNYNTWEDVEYKDYFIKYLTQKDSQNNRIIKVGMLLNQSLVRWKGLNTRITIFVGIILAIITVISFFLTYVLFRPVKMLAEHVNLMAEKMEHGEYLELKSWFNKLEAKARRNDEFSSLIKSLNKLSVKVTETQTSNQRWSALMAHELKTPMTILRMSIDDLMTEIKADPKKLQAVEMDLKKLEDIIMDFLEWASAENDPAKPQIHAIYPAKRMEELTYFTEKSSRDTQVTFKNDAPDDFKIFCNPIHFDQVINNLLTNATKYGEGKIQITCSENKISIKDNGHGIPEGVIENFGKPFNKYKQKDASGHGLGLAWVNTIAKKYGWEIQFQQDHGTLVVINFPSV